MQCLADGGLAGAAGRYFSPHGDEELIRGAPHFQGIMPPKSPLAAAADSGEGVQATPEWANEMTQGAIDNVRDPGVLRKIIEFALGDSPSMGLMQAATTTPSNAFAMNPAKWGAEAMPQGAKGWVPSPALSALAMMLHSKEAGAPTLEDGYEGHGQWQPFKKFRE